MLTPPDKHLKRLLRHIYIEKGQIKCFIFSFLGWGLKVTYNTGEKKKKNAVWNISPDSTLLGVTDDA